MHPLKKSNEATEAKKSVADFSASESTCSLEKGWLCSANVSKSVNVFALIPLLTQKKERRKNERGKEKMPTFQKKISNVGQEDSQQIINLAIAY